jgi:hypothetical protein
MRNLILAAGLLAPLALASPSAAQPRPDPRDEEVVRSLPDPREIEEMGDTLGRVAEAILDIPVGRIADAVDPQRRGRHRNETLGDLASRDDPHARERIRSQVGAATVGLGAMVEELAVLAPVMRRTLEDAARRMEDAVEDRRRARGWERRDREDPERDDRDRERDERDRDTRERDGGR